MDSLWKALLSCLAIVLLLFKFIDFCVAKQWIGAQLSRKLLHTFVGSVFIICWNLFPTDHYWSRYIAAVIPLLLTVQFALIALSIIKDEVTVKSMSRSGAPIELLYGPVGYGFIFVTFTIYFWNTSPIGIIPLAILCGGDGFADIIGRRFGTSNRYNLFEMISPTLFKHLPNYFQHRDKSMVGSIAFFIFGYLFSIWLLYVTFGSTLFTLSLVLKLVIICVVSTLVEAFPLRDFDNYTTTLTALFLSKMLL